MGQNLEETDTSIMDLFEFWVGEDAVILQEFLYWKAHLNSEDRHQRRGRGWAIWCSKIKERLQIRTGYLLSQIATNVFSGGLIHEDWFLPHITTQCRQSLGNLVNTNDNSIFQSPNNVLLIILLNDDGKLSKEEQSASNVV